MPYKCEQKGILIPTELKRSAKLTADQKLEILFLHKRDGISQRQLARDYKVSRRLIGFIVNPESQKANYAQRVATGGSKQYYDREKHTEAMRDHRRYKNDLYKSDRIK